MNTVPIQERLEEQIKELQRQCATFKSDIDQLKAAAVTQRYQYYGDLEHQHAPLIPRATFTPRLMNRTKTSIFEKARVIIVLAMYAQVTFVALLSLGGPCASEEDDCFGAIGCSMLFTLGFLCVLVCVTNDKEEFYWCGWALILLCKINQCVSDALLKSSNPSALLWGLGVAFVAAIHIFIASCLWSLKAATLYFALAGGTFSYAISVYPYENGSGQ